MSGPPAYLPFGYEYNPQITVNNYKFTGLERDDESQFDHAWFRQYSSTQGRWMSPDPAGLAAVDPTNPQTWNRYAYVAGNPVNRVDPDGLYWTSCDSLGICDNFYGFSPGGGYGSTYANGGYSPPRRGGFSFGVSSGGYFGGNFGSIGTLLGILPGENSINLPVINSTPYNIIQGVLTGNWGPLFPAIPGYNSPAIFDATPILPGEEASITGGRDRREDWLLAAGC